VLDVRYLDTLLASKAVGITNAVLTADPSLNATIVAWVAPASYAYMFINVGKNGMRVCNTLFPPFFNAYKQISLSFSNGFRSKYDCQFTHRCGICIWYATMSRI
jgi:hypothetical protein